MDTYDRFLEQVSIPRFRRLRQSLQRDHLEDPAGALRAELERSGLLGRIQPGMRVALTAGSREIANFALLLRTMCDVLRQRGAKPFIIPAMGSHGGAIAENQTALIAHFGITEEAMGVPILSSMETVEVGKTVTGDPVYFDRYAAQAGAIVPLGRIKMHTGFHGPIESGVMKMLAIGCGKQRGAAAIHKYGFSDMSKHVVESANVILQTLPVAFGVGILENVLHQTCGIHVLAPETMYEQETALLKQAYQLMPQIPYDKIDVLIVDEIGKNISGTGMDANITGRSALFGITRPYAERVVLLDLADASDGCAYGMGNADVITQRFFDKIVYENTIPNGMTSLEIRPMKTPITMYSDLNAIRFALRTLSEKRPAREPYIVWLHNTLCMEEFYVSDSLAHCAPSAPVELGGELLEAVFDESRSFAGFKPVADNPA